MASKLFHFIIRALLTLLSWLPLSALHAIAFIAGRVMYLLNGRSAKVTRINLGLCFPEKSEAEIEALVKASLVETAKTAAEMGKVWLRPVEKVRQLAHKRRNEHLFDEALAAGKGVVVIGPHIGNWELASLAGLAGHSPTILYQPPENPYLEELVRLSRSKGGGELVPTNKRGVAALFQTLRKGGVTGILPDQEPGVEGGTFAPFFNRPALTMQLISKLLVKTGARAVFLFAKRLPNSEGFELVYIPAPEAIYSEDLETSVAGLNAGVEACVLDAVEQYQWEYKRYKKSPEGKSRLYVSAK